MILLRLLVLVGVIILALDSYAAAPPATRPSTQPARKFTDIDTNRFQELAKQSNTVILDVRTPEEYAAGHLPGAVLIDVRDPEFAKKIAALDKSKTYLVHCRSGRRSVTACDALGEAGFANLYNMLGGLVAWEEAGKPVER
jgi:rhodanese-related sulfurtransferase